jgi:hypothetical protein
MFGIDDAIAAGLKVLDKFIPDDEQKAKAESELRESLLAWDASQNEVNKIEAGHANIFVSGWRPFVGWTCGVAFAYHYVAQPVALFILAAFGKSVAMPAFAMESLLTVLLGLLGLGGLRTYEKHRGLTK